MHRSYGEERQEKIIGHRPMGVTTLNYTPFFSKKFYSSYSELIIFHKKGGLKMRFIKNLIVSSIIGILIWNIILLVTETMCKYYAKQIEERTGNKDAD